jgi:acetyltransferase-like isoleucine patch superfamily enzyme
MFIFLPELKTLIYKEACIQDSKISPKANIYEGCTIRSSEVGAYSYISQNAIVNHTTIGKFCSIGPNLMCGWGIHPTNTISTSPMFYSTQKQNGTTLSNYNKIQETKAIHIGNDVFIGMNVTILDGIKIGNGAVIGAGAVVSKDIPPYAIAVGNPIQIKNYRFDKEIIEKLEFIQWWNWSLEELSRVEKMILNTEKFTEKYAQ